MNISPLSCKNCIGCLSEEELSRYKILVLTFKCLLGIAPGYLLYLLQKRDNKGTRADDRDFLVTPRVRRSTFAGRSFSFASPTLCGTDCHAD